MPRSQIGQGQSIPSSPLSQGQLKYM